MRAVPFQIVVLSNHFLDFAKRVKAGARLLDKKVPNWRKIMRENKDRFDIGDGACCILGTLEHHSRQMQLLNKRRVAGMSEADYERGVKRLNLLEAGAAREHGFVRAEGEIGAYDALQQLWRAEFEE